jgi:hypothetical protein
VGICGGVVTNALFRNLEASSAMIPIKVTDLLHTSMENLFREEFRNMLSPQSEAVLSLAVSDAMSTVFWIILGAALLCLVSVMVLYKKRLTGEPL